MTVEGKQFLSRKIVAFSQDKCFDTFTINITSSQCFDMSPFLIIICCSPLHSMNLLLLILSSNLQ
jgi:hypothetical protein